MGNTTQETCDVISVLNAACPMALVIADGETIQISWGRTRFTLSLDYKNKPLAMEHYISSAACPVNAVVESATTIIESISTIVKAYHHL